MFNIREFLVVTEVPKLAKMHNRIAGAAISLTLVLGLLPVGADFALAGPRDTLAHTAVMSHIVPASEFTNPPATTNRAIIHALYAYQNGMERPASAYHEYEYAYGYRYDYDSVYNYAYEYEYIPIGGSPGYVMYLTFDDGPTANVTPLILDILAERDIRATFFVVGRNVRANPDVMRRIVYEGHVVGIHSDTHDYDQIYESLDAFIADFRAIQEMIEGFTGYTPRIYRFPGGSVTRFNANVRDAAIDWLEENGYVYFDWNASIDDSIGGNRTPQQLLQRGLETTSGEHVIMLAHDTRPATAEMMGEMIDILAEQYVFDVLTVYVEPTQMTRR
ncbi:MAG: polysaccharide deacetylase [Defluviitaleaceae bacterium]|nr:polysaccharide deacetylase [Defluviitaleaceae bacterium]